MAEENQNLETNEAAAATTALNSTMSNMQQSSVEDEKLLKQSDVNKIVGGVKVDAYEKGQRDERARIEQERATRVNAASPPPVPTQKDTVTISPEELERMIDEGATKRANLERATQVVNQFAGKMQGGIEKYSDFEDVVTKLDIPNLPGHVIDWANSMDNTADVMYDLAKHPRKLTDILVLSQTSPALARDEFNRLSDSIKQNEQAVKANTSAAAPLDQVKHSTAGKDNSVIRSIDDMRNLDFLRG
jgi:hypothetical protein